MTQLSMYKEEEIRDLVARAGGVHEVSVISGLRIQTIYRLMRGQNKPSFETNIKLKALENELGKKTSEHVEPIKYVEPIKVINYSLLIKKLLKSNEIEKANKVLDDLWDYATHAQIDYEEEE